jgi:uncharacterized protein YcbK (DUF882 family)
MKLTKNVSRHEVACKCNCGMDTIDFETLMVVQECCDHFAIVLGVDKVVVIINSGCRCNAHNEAVGGSLNSYHKKSRAIDFKIVGVLPVAVYAYLSTIYEDKYGLGSYSSFTHIDTRTGGQARWTG